MKSSQFSENKNFTRRYKSVDVITTKLVRSQVNINTKRAINHFYELAIVHLNYFFGFGISLFQVWSLCGFVWFHFVACFFAIGYTGIWTRATVITFYPWPHRDVNAGICTMNDINVCRKRRGRRSQESMPRCINFSGYLCFKFGPCVVSFCCFL